MAKKKPARKPKAKPRPVYTYKIIVPGKADELVRCENMNIYGDCVEFMRQLPTNDPENADWITFLAIPTRAIDRVELVEDTAAPTEEQP